MIVPGGVDADTVVGRAATIRDRAVRRRRDEEGRVIRPVEQPAPARVGRRPSSRGEVGADLEPLVGRQGRLAGERDVIARRIVGGGGAVDLLLGVSDRVREAVGEGRQRQDLVGPPEGARLDETQGRPPHPGTCTELAKPLVDPITLAGIRRRRDQAVGWEANVAIVVDATVMISGVRLAGKEKDAAKLIEFATGPCSR